LRPVPQPASSKLKPDSGASASAVADRHREGVGGVVGSRRLGQPEQGPDHPLDLALAGPSGAADRHLDRLRRVGEAADAALRRGQHRDAAGLPDGHRRVHVLAEVDRLDRHRLRLVPGDQLGQSPVDPLQATLHRLLRGRLDHTAVERNHVVALHAHDSEAEIGRTGVDPHDYLHGK